MREGDFYGAKKTLLASGGKSCVQYTGNGCVYYPGRKSNRISHAVRCGLDHFCHCDTSGELAGKAIEDRKEAGNSNDCYHGHWLIVLVGYFAVSRIAAEVTDLIQNFPDIYAQLEEGMREIGNTLSGAFSRLPRGVQNGWTTIVENLDTYMGNLVSKISEPTVTAAGNFAKRLPSYLISFIVAILAAYFFTIQREEVIAWFHKIAPPSVEKRMILVMDNLKYAVGGYFKAQFKIMGVVFLILFAGFLVLGIHYAVLVAFLISFLDFLPFFGTGTALIPWAIYSVFIGEYKITAGLVIIYAVSQVVRQLLQPKLVGDSMGMNPLVTLLLLYVGYKIKGVFGMILAVPLGLVLINMCQAGAFDYILDDVKILVEGILGLREELPQGQKENSDNT